MIGVTSAGEVYAVEAGAGSMKRESLGTIDLERSDKVIHAEPIRHVGNQQWVTEVSFLS